MHFFTNSVIALALVIGSGASFAADSEDNSHFKFDTRTATVKFSDLNLSEPVDKEILLERIRYAATEICEREGDIRQLTSQRERARCLEESYRNALVAISTKTGADIASLSAKPTVSRDLVAE